MHHIPHPKAQAETLRAIFAERGVTVSLQDSLEYVAKLQGFKSWQHCSAAVAKPTVAPVEVPDEQLDEEDGPYFVPCDDKEGLRLFVGCVTVDTTMSGSVGVWAEDLEHARQLMRSAGREAYEKGRFSEDEGNYRRASDFYLGDSDAVECISDINVEGDMHDLTKSATWEDEKAKYCLMLDRDEPDHADESRRHSVSVTLEVTTGRKKISRELQGALTAPGTLSDALFDAIESDTYEAIFEELVAQATSKRRSK
ncbi:hypothetical protein F6X40_35575 [Paraburkholderia sp. UCT31]|uniref:glyoxalase superfamily protein n=1 Tax=Paraburkholderia sp. UCT31 TaxID=2615209 RepID=UPI0016567C39|nr:glyoxalase superfamily protein [Paraburkholderia sp. UCT31]MBC8741871.1 hypothetical protein [Paraburkholderia sp. UCT31]